MTTRSVLACLMGFASLGLGACDNAGNDDGNDDGAANEETGDPADGLTCEQLDATPIEASCGSGSDTLDETDENALVACVVAAIDAGRSFSVSDRYYENDGQYDTTRLYSVTADGEMWDHYSGFSDLCTVDETTLHGTVDLDALAACTSWDCILGALQSVEVVATCDNQTNCDGV